MQTYSGVNGKAKFGTSNTLNIKSWTATHTQRFVETNGSRSSPAVVTANTFYQWRGSVTLEYDSDLVDWKTANTPFKPGQAAVLLLAFTSLTGPGVKIDTARLEEGTWGTSLEGNVTYSVNWHSSGTVTGPVDDVSA